MRFLFCSPCTGPETRERNLGEARLVFGAAASTNERARKGSLFTGTFGTTTQNIDRKNTQDNSQSYTIWHVQVVAAIDWGPSRSNAPNIVEIHNSFCHFANLDQLHNFRANGLVKPGYTRAHSHPCNKTYATGLQHFLTCGPLRSVRRSSPPRAHEDRPGAFGRQSGRLNV
jgi:hypothetical protein